MNLRILVRPAFPGEPNAFFEEQYGVMCIRVLQYQSLHITRGMTTKGVAGMPIEQVAEGVWTDVPTIIMDSL